MGATLALGIGLTTAIFSLAYSVLLRTLPYPAPERLVSLHSTSSNPIAAGARLGACSADWADWRAQSQSFEDIALTRMVTNFNLSGDGRPERVLGARTTWNLLPVLGIRPMFGRFFTEEEARRDASVAVLSYGFWERRFASDPAVVGRKIQLNGAGASRLRRQTLAEVLPLSVVGGAGGALLAWWLLKASASWLPAQLTSLVPIRMDWTVTAVALALSALITLLAGIFLAGRRCCWRAWDCTASCLTEQGCVCGSSLSERRSARKPTTYAGWYSPTR